MELQNFITYVQLALDICLIVFLAIWFFKRPTNNVAPQTAAPELIESLEKVIEETKGIGESFDENLKERQDMIRKLLAKLDHKLNEAEKLCRRLEALQKTAEVVSSGTQASVPGNQGRQEIMRLAGRGLDAAAIAGRLQKPLGEVELILNLQRISKKSEPTAEGA
ncbi:MAG: hypothetical protein AB2L11_05840 [Syntrophobacteraceae bacterium]